ncbi:MAG: hypothetical protein A3F91_11605 [Flavobacteria bacterium RIFCSPLOWO2_12_FULL_35_11]|nr:MAG: hypothetical protein A3F91_11605 [Flavobacteria bacterium RIFCSPLOWO2_12_FULL_35_11]
MQRKYFFEVFSEKKIAAESLTTFSVVTPTKKAGRLKKFLFSKLLFSPKNCFVIYFVTFLRFQRIIL